jgi:predicted secreted protein
MKTFSLVKIFLILLQLIAIKSNEENIRIVNLKDFTGENSYLPVVCGQTFIIEVNGNPTTGYSWTLEVDSKNQGEKLLTPLNLNERNSGEYFSHNKNYTKGEEPRVGVGGIYHFKFHAHENKSGYEELNFVHKRSWNEEGASKHKVIVKVVNLENKNDL